MGTDDVLDIQVAPEKLEWIEKACAIIKEASRDELEFLANSLSKNALSYLVRHSRYLQRHIFKGYRPDRLPNNAYRKLALCAKSNESVCKILITAWLISNAKLETTLTQIEVDDLYQAVVQLAEETGEKDWRKLLWTLRFDSRLTIEQISATGLVNELQNPDSEIRMRIANLPPPEEISSDSFEQTEEVPQQTETENDTDIINPSSNEGDSTVPFAQVISSGNTPTKKEIEAMLGNVEILVQNHRQTLHDLAVKLQELSQTLITGDVAVQEVGVTFAELSKNWTTLTQQLPADFSQIQQTALAITNFLDQQEAIPELEEITASVTTLTIIPEEKYLNVVLQWSKDLQENWKTALTIIHSYQELCKKIEKSIESINAIYSLLRSNFDDIEVKPEIDVLKGWKKRISDWKSLLSQTSQVEVELLEEVKQREQQIRKEIISKQAELKSVTSGLLFELNVKRTVGNLPIIELENMSLLNLLEFRSQVEQAYQYAQTSNVPTKPEAILSILDEILATSRADGLLTKYTEIFLGHLLYGAAKQETVPANLLWQACSKVYNLLAIASKNETGFFETFGYLIVAAALEKYLPKHQLLDALGFIKLGFLPKKGIQEVWQHPNVLGVFKEYGIKHLPSSLVQTPLQSLTAEEISALAALAKVGNDLLWDSVIQFALAAALLSTEKPSSEEYKIGANTLVTTLGRTRRFGSAFLAWQTLTQDCPDVLSEDQIIILFEGLFDRFWQATDHKSLQIIGEICEKLTWASLGSDMKMLYLLVNMASCLLPNKVPDIETSVTTEQFLSEIRTDYPSLALWIEHQLEGGKTISIPRSESLKEKERQLQIELRKLERIMHEHNLRGVSLALRIERDNLERIFTPLDNAMRTQSPLQTDILIEIDAVDAEAIITQHSFQREAKRNDRLHYPLLGDMIRYNQDRLDQFRLVAELRLQLDELRSIIRKYADESEAAQEEGRKILEQISSGRLILQEFYKSVGLTGLFN